MMLCQLFTTVEYPRANQAWSKSGKKVKIKWFPYTGTRLHRVAQITAEVSGLVLCLIAAGQLGQALRDKRTHW